MQSSLESVSSQGRAEVIGSPGAGARNWGAWQLLAPLFGLVLLVGFVAGAALRPEFLQEGMAGALLLVLVVLLIFAYRHGSARLERHLRGARGEEVVAMRLAGLSDQWTVFHSVPLAGAGGGRDADHVVVGKGRVFLVETLNWDQDVVVHPDGVSLNGRMVDFDPFPKARDRADALVAGIREGAEVRVEVTPVICFVGSRGKAGKRDDIAYTDERGLIDLLASVEDPIEGAAIAEKVSGFLKSVMQEEGVLS